MDERDERVVVTPAAPGSETEPVTVSSGQALVGVFTRPRPTFEGMRAKPHYRLALAILLVFQLLFTIAIFESGAILNDTVAKLEAEGKPQDQIDRVEQMFQQPVTVAFSAVGGVLGFAFVTLVVSGLMYFMGNLIQGAKLTFTHYVSAAAHGYLVGLVDQTVRAILAFQKGTLHISLGAGLLLPEDMGPLGKALDTATDPLMLWSTAVLAIGVSVYARKGIGFGILTVLPGFLIALAASAFR